MKKTALCKRLLALFVCVFAWVGVNAYEYMEDNTVLEVYPSDVANSFNNHMFADIPSTVTTVKLVGTFSNGWTSGWLQDGSTSGKGNITTIDLSAATIPATVGWSFCSFRALKNIIWPSNDNPNQITVLPGYAFKNTGLETVYIPGYIQRIKSQAFDVDSGEKLLKTIYFEEYAPEAPVGDGKSKVNMVIERQGFSNTSGLVDVYVLANGTLNAENNAFPEVVTYGQGDTSRSLTRLHFPEDKAADYVNQTHTLTQDIASDDGRFQAWLVEHYSKANDNGTPNGWYEFVSSGSNPPKEDKDWGDVVLRTFSHPTIDYVVPKGAKAYIVNSVSKATGDKYTLTLRKVNVIPHGTGVILYGGTNYSNTYVDETTHQPVTKRTLEMMAVKFDGAPYTSATTGDYHNLLVSTSVNAQGEPSLAMDGIEVSPYETDNSGAVTYRNFFMGKFKSTNSGKKKENQGFANFVGFFRAIKSTISARKAYLRLPNSELEASSCGEIIVPADVEDVEIGGIKIRSYRVEYTEQSKYNDEKIFTEAQMQEKGYWYKSATQSIEWTDDWGVRNTSLAMAKFDGEPFIEIEEEDGVATLVVPASMVEQEDTESYYTLQGVKVSNPSKGVYIKNGKKLIIK